MFLDLSPEARKIKLEEKINEKEAELKKSEKAYESLIKFKRSVESSQENFEQINNNKKGVLYPVKKYCKNSRAASRYYYGMEDSLDSVGAKLVGVSFVGLLSAIKLKISAYKAEISSIEDYIELLQTHLEKTNEEIKSK